MPDYPNAVIRNPRYKFGEYPSIKDWIGADPATGFDLPTGRKVVDGVAVAGSSTFSSAAGFADAAERQLIAIRGAGPNSTTLRTTIVGVSDDLGTVELADAISTDVAAATSAYGPDSSPPMQQGVDDSPYLLIPRGIYLFGSKITFAECLHLDGRSRSASRFRGNETIAALLRAGAELWNAGPDEHLFEFMSDLDSAAYDINSGISFGNLTIYSKSVVKINRETIPTPPDYQGHVLRIGFHNVELHGDYLNTTDPNDSTDIEPDWDEMTGYGVGINLSQCFGAVIDGYSLIQHFGIGVYLRNSDECVISGNRITQNGHQVAVRGTITSGYGNTNKILNNALGANRRVGAIRQEQGFGTVIRNNYFETYSDACRFVWSINSIGLQWCGNRIDNPNYPPFAGHTVTTPICFIDDWNQVLISDNLMGVNGYPVPPMSFGYTYWTGVFNIDQYVVRRNSSHWPTPGTFHPLDGTLSPTIPGVRTEALDPLRFASDNLPSLQLAGSASFPFEVNSGTGRPATIKTAGAAELAVRFQLRSLLYRRYAIRCSVQNANGGAVGAVAGMSVNYIGAGTTSIGTFALNPTTTNGMDIRQVAVTIPPAENADGIIEVKIATQLARWEEIRLIAIDEQNGIVVNYGDTASYDPITGTVSTASASTNQHNSPIYDIVDVSRPVGEEIGAIRISRLGTLAKKFFMGWSDAIGSAGGAFLQAVQSAVSYRPLSLNPSGGPVLIRQATDDGANDIQSTGFAKHTGDFKVTGQITGQGAVQFTGLPANSVVVTDGSSSLSTVGGGVTGSVTVVTGITVSTTTIGYAGGANPATYVSNVTASTTSLGFNTGIRNV